MSLFTQFVNDLPVAKTVTVIHCCPRCTAEAYRATVKVNGLNEWAYKGVPNGGITAALDAGQRCPNKCFA